MQISDNLRGALYMTIAMAAFTLNDTCMKAVTEDLPLFQAIFLRGVLTLTALAALGWRMGGLKLRPQGDDLRWLGWRSLGEVAGTLAFLLALKHMPLANLSAIMQSLPLMVTLAAAFILRERVGWRRMTAILVGFAGVLLIVRPGSADFDVWAVGGLVSVAAVVVRDLSTRRLSAEVPSVTVAFYAATAVALMALVLLPLGGWAPVTARSAALIGGAAAFLIVGYLFVVMTMRVGEVSIVAPFRYTALLFAIALGWVSFGDLPDLWTSIGAMIIVASGIFTFYRERRLARAAA